MLAVHSVVKNVENKSILIGLQIWFPGDHIQSLFFHDSTALVALSFLIFELTRSHPATPHSARVLWIIDRPVEETCLPDNAQPSRETDICALGGIEPAIPDSEPP